MKIEKIEMEGIWEPYRQPIENAGVRGADTVPRTPGRSPGIQGAASLPEETAANLARELDQYLELFQPCFRYDQEKYAAAYIKGLMSDLEYKSVEPIALRYGMSVRGIQRFLNSGKWLDQQMWDTYRSHLARAIACDGGMITVDRHETPKKGRHSVGVAHQYCGSTGKVTNCQSGVYVGYSGERGRGLIDCSLYLPEIWFDEGHKKLREKCGVPENATFRTKAAMAAEMVQEAHSSGLFPARWVGADSFFGNSKEFLDAIPEGMWYFVDTHPDALVFCEMPTMVAPAYSGRGRRGFKEVPSAAPVTVEDIAGGGNSAGGTNPVGGSAGGGNPADSRSVGSCTGGGSVGCDITGHGNPVGNNPVGSNPDWAKAYVGEGPTGPIIVYEKCVRVIRGENGIPGEEVWLYIRKWEDGSHRYSFCNAPPDTPVSVIRNAALMRYPIGQCFGECKSRLGLAQYEGRSWNTWYRHNLLVFVAHLFLICLRHKYKKPPS